MRRGQSMSVDTVAICYPNRSSLLSALIALLLFIVFSSLCQIGFISRTLVSTYEDRSGSLESIYALFSSEAEGAHLALVTAVTKTNAIDDLASTSSFAPIVYFLPNEPFFQAPSMVEEAIGPKVLSDSARNPLQNCSVTVQFQLFIPQSGSSSIPWVLQSMTIPSDFSNSSSVEISALIPKAYGGDEIFVEWRSSIDPTLDAGVALVSDSNDGTYTLDFVRPPILQYNHTAAEAFSHNDFGRVTIYYDYSCGIGGMFAPDKDDFARAGEIHTSFSLDGIPRPHIKEFIPPNQDHSIDLSKYHTVISFGDSLMLQLAREFSRRRYWRPNILYTDNVNQCLSDPDSDVNIFLEKFHKWHGDQLAEAANRSESVAVIAGSAVWDALRGCVRSGYVDHETSIRSFVKQIQAMYPTMDFYWKSPSAVALHRRSTLQDLVNDTVKLQRSRYISNAVLTDLYKLQKDIMAELNIPFLDLFEAYYLSIPWTMAGSAVHFDDSIASLLLGYFWPGFGLREAFQRDY
jgi:hypothetical protein